MIKCIKWFIALIILVFNVSACTQTDVAAGQDLYNESMGAVARYNDDVYYIKNHTMWRNITAPEQFSENTYSVQEYNGILYYTVKSDENYLLMEYNGSAVKENTALPEGVLKKIIIDDSRIYALINNKLFFTRA